MKSIFERIQFSMKRADLFGRVTFALAMTAVLIGVPHPAMAQTVSFLGDMMCGVVTNIMPNAAGVGGWGIGQVIDGVAYIAGAVTVGSGLLLLIRWHDNARETPLMQPIWRMIAGAGLLALPSMAGWLLNSLALNHGPGGIASSMPCSPYAGGDTPVAAASLDNLMTNLVGSIKDPLTLLLSIISLLIGMIFIFRGLTKASRYGTDPRSYSATNIIANLVIGAILVSMGASLDLIMGTLFGDGSLLPSGTFWNNFNAGTWVTNTGLNATQLATFETSVTAALTFFQLVGLIAFIRGWMILKSYAEGTGQATAAQGLTHVFGGALAINIYQILTVLDNTFGTGFLS